MKGLEMNSTDTNLNNIASITWAWTPDCGALHIETNPESIGPECPDGLTGWSDQ